MEQRAIEKPPTESEQQLHQWIIDYYRAAGADYAAWSKNLHMHFGYFRRGMNPFALEEMLNEMPRQVFKRLQLTPQSRGKVLDLGCGVGASLRMGARLFPDLTWQGVTIVPEQQQCCESVNRESAAYDNVRVSVDDYENLSLPDESVDFVYALESMSHARGENKVLMISEMLRVLKPGGRFVVADGFLRKPVAELSPFLRGCHQELCRGWALPVMGVAPKVQQEFVSRGISDMEMEEISWRVAVSIAHIPYVTTKFFLGKCLAGDLLGAARLKHLKSCILTGVIGLARRSFAYYLLSGRKPASR